MAPADGQIFGDPLSGPIPLNALLRIWADGPGAAWGCAGWRFQECFLCLEIIKIQIGSNGTSGRPNVPPNLRNPWMPLRGIEPLRRSSNAPSQGMDTGSGWGPRSSRYIAYVRLGMINHENKSNKNSRTTVFPLFRSRTALLP